MTNMVERPESTQLHEMFKDFVKKNYRGNRSELARWLEAKPQDVDRWYAGTRLPAWVLLRILRKFPGAVNSFIRKAQTEIVAEEAADWYRDPKRRELIAEIKQLLPAADDDMIDTLLHTVKIFRRTIQNMMSKPKEDAP